MKTAKEMRLETATKQQHFSNLYNQIVDGAEEHFEINAKQGKFACMVTDPFGQYKDDKEAEDMSALLKKHFEDYGYQVKNHNSAQFLVSWAEVEQVDSE